MKCLTLWVQDSVSAYLPKAADYRDEGLNMNALIERLASDRSGLCEYFTVDDLMHLRRGGRLSGIAAMVGNGP